MDTWILFGGRLHLLILHLPIGIFFLLLLIEGANGLNRIRSGGHRPFLAAEVRSLILVVLALTTLLSAGFGLLLALEGGYNADLLGTHRLYGLICAGLTVLLLLFRDRIFPYSLLLLLTGAGITLTGHHGASLTHGKDFLPAVFRAAATPDTKDAEDLPELTSLSDIVVFEHAVKPILEQRCESCHGETRSRGKLRLDSPEWIALGGKTGPAIVAGDLSASELIVRILLPEDDEDHMPPADKPQLSHADLLVLQWWVRSGASYSASFEELNPPEAIAQAISTRLGLPTTEDEPLPSRDWVVQLAADLERELGIVASPLHPAEPWIEINARLKGSFFGDEELARLEPLAPVIVRLDLGQTAVTDAGLAVLSHMQRLEALKLDRTGITDEGLQHLKWLDSLQSLSLFSTSVTDTGLDHLNLLSRLRKVFLWQTQVSEDGARTLESRLTNTRELDRLKHQIVELEDAIRAQQAVVNIGESAAVTEALETDEPTSPLSDGSNPEISRE